MRATTLGLLALTLMGVGAIAQPAPRPDFSGAWTMDPARSESAAQGQATGQVTVTIAQTGSELKIETTRDGKTTAARYPLGERPTMSTEVTGMRRAFWDGPTLVNEGSVDIQDKTVAFHEARMLSADKAEMTVETTLKLEHGYELKGTQTVVKGKNVFVRGR
jgi:hypothetical protein